MNLCYVDDPLGHFTKNYMTTSGCHFWRENSNSKNYTILREKNYFSKAVDDKIMKPTFLVAVLNYSMSVHLTFL